MKFDEGVLQEMPHVVALQARLSIDRYNRATYEPVATNYRALVTAVSEEVRTMAGEEAISNTRVTMAPVVVNADNTLTYLDELPDIKPEHKITLPDDTTPVILAIEKHNAREELNMSHIVIRT